MGRSRRKADLSPPHQPATVKGSMQSHHPGLNRPIKNEAGEDGAAAGELRDGKLSREEEVLRLRPSP